MSDSYSLYVDKDTVLHRLNARAKLALALALFTVAYIFGHPAVVAVPLALGFAGLVLGGGLRNLRRVWYIIVALFVVGLVVWPSFTEAGGPIVLETGFFSLSRRELLFALGRSERIAAFILGGLVFVTTTSNEEIIRGMRELGIPFAFCFAVGTALRLFPTFLGAAGTVRQAQEARGLDLSGGNPIERVRKFVPLLIPVFMTAFRNIQTQSMALEARGFDTRRERTFYRRESFSTLDWAATGLSVVVVVAAIVLSVLGYGQV
jgi:energy-coupling factor transporter transmembrane protein EcfT